MSCWLLPALVLLKIVSLKVFCTQEVYQSKIVHKPVCVVSIDCRRFAVEPFK